MAIDLNSMSKQELEALLKDVQNALKTLESRKKAEALAAAEKAAKEHGFSLDEILRKEKTSGKRPPKYRNPENPKQTWTGRGRKPDWLKAELAKGRNPEEFAI
ncbi:DNA-binding protein [Maritimibacter sp. 55A14]|uniref:H-NS histone family protein n=1 Tax=Maritimibacter sp. 55A14 TaxID=2174844 RepID=UPI000D606A31|nr:H-NS histone family protein [Maritimibacter sp. 55A14]PWE29273.1 DNA-binding protein [Maritimibacter sp. 55A14]